MGEAARKMEPPPITPPTQRGIPRLAAAAYIGVGPTKFDQLVADGRMPKPKRIDGRVIWDIRALDAYFDRLPSDGHVSENEWDD